MKISSSILAGDIKQLTIVSAIESLYVSSCKLIIHISINTYLKRMVASTKYMYK